MSIRITGFAVVVAVATGIGFAAQAAGTPKNTEECLAELAALGEAIDAANLPEEKTNPHMGDAEKAVAACNAGKFDEASKLMGALSKNVLGK